MTGVPLIDLRAQYRTIENEVRAAVERVFASQRFIHGPEVEALEEEVAAYSGCAHGVGMSSGTDALLASLMAIGVQPGDEVITTPFTFFATAGTVHRLGATPVFVDIDPATFNIDPAGIEAAITERTRAIVPVHLYGRVADMDPIVEIAERRGVVLVEDAAQAIGALYRDRRAGSIGQLGTLSFFPTKNLGGCGDGGMVVTSDAELAERLRILRDHGSRPKYYHHVVGGNFRLDALQAAVLRVKLAHLDGWTRARVRNAALYRRLFAEAGLTLDGEPGDDLGDRPGVRLPEEGPPGGHIYHQLVIRSGRRDELREHLTARGIGSEVYYPVPLHLQECFSGLGYRPGDLPASERAAAEVLALPVYPELTERMIAAVVEAIGEFYRV